MNTVDKISKEVINLTEYAKDVVKNNLATSPLKGQLKLEESQLTSLIQLIDVSITSGIQKGLPNLQKNIKKIIQEAPSSAVKK